jgi:hypothetical protein
MAEAVIAASFPRRSVANFCLKRKFEKISRKGGFVMNKERSLAHIETITEIQPITGKDRIVLAKVLGWSVVIAKDEFKVGDNVVYVEIDSRINTNIELFALLNKDADRYGFVLIKTRKFGDSYSQGICFRVPDEYKGLKAGSNLTKLFNKGREGKALAIIHNEEYPEMKGVWEKPWTKKEKLTVWKRIRYFLFPKRKKRELREKRKVPSPYGIGVSKTDEERIQNLVELFENLKTRNVTLTATEKLDGQSFTAHIDANGKIYVASRNVALYHIHKRRTRQSVTYGGSTWCLAFERYGLREKLEKMLREHKVPVTVQGELIGCHIGVNHYKVTTEDVTLKVFNIKVDGNRVSFDEMEKICKKYGLETVPYLGTVTLPEDITIEEFIAMSDGPSVLNKNVVREGIVYRTEDYRTSFKAISNRFLVKRGE